VAESVPFPNFPFSLGVSAAALDGGRGNDQPQDKGPVTIGQGGQIEFRKVDLRPLAGSARSRIAVSQPIYDDMGKLLDKLGKGYEYKTLTPDELRSRDWVERFDILFLTCASEVGQSDGGMEEALRAFVGHGGTLYASDLRLPLLTRAFPGRKCTRVDLAAIRRWENAEQALLKGLIGREVPTLRRTLDELALGEPARANAGKIYESLVTRRLFGDRWVIEPQRAEQTLRAEAAEAEWQATDTDLDALAAMLKDRASAITKARGRPPNPSKAAAAFRARGAEYDRLSAALAQDPGENASLRGLAPQSVEATVEETALHERVGESLSLHFESGGWMPAMLGGPDVQVLLRGTYSAASGDRIEAPLLVKFPEGEGTVIFTSFHNASQNSEKELELLRYLVFTAATARAEAVAEKEMLKGGFSPAQRSHSVGEDSITRTHKVARAGPVRFSLSFPGKDARLRLTLIAPNGQKYEETVTSSVVIEAVDAPAGEWTYSVTALEVPYPKFPFGVSIGEGSGAPGPG
jgi:hypothetical protein